MVRVEERIDWEVGDKEQECGKEMTTGSLIAPGKREGLQEFTCLVGENGNNLVLFKQKPGELALPSSC